MEILSVLLFSGALCIGIGLYVSRHISDFTSFASARNVYGSFAITATIVASFVGGGFVMGTAEKSFSLGIVPALGLLGFSLQLLLTGWLIAPRIASLKDSLTVGDIFEKNYGHISKILVGVLWMSFCGGIVTAQMAALGKLLSVFLPYDYEWNILFGAMIVVLYCYKGGIRAVVTTDVLQFIVLAFALPLTIFYALQATGGVESFATQIPSSYWEIPGSWSWLQLGVVFGSFVLGDALIPPVIERLHMAKSPKQAKRSFLLGGALTIPLCGIACLLGVAAFVLDPSIDANQSIPFVINTTLSSWVKALAVSGLIAVIISSLDTYLNSAAVVMVHDIITPLSPSPLSPERKLELARYTTLFIGVVGIFFAVSATSVFDILLYTYKFWGPIILVSLVGIFFNIRLSKLGFYSSCTTAAFVVLMWNLFDLETHTGMIDLIPGLLVNFIVFTLFKFYESGASLKIPSLSKASRSFA